jgi:hypothetical protein
MILGNQDNNLSLLAYNHIDEATQYIRGQILSNQG